LPTAPIVERYASDGGASGQATAPASASFTPSIACGIMSRHA